MKQRTMAALLWEIWQGDASYDVHELAAEGLEELLGPEWERIMRERSGCPECRRTGKYHKLDCSKRMVTS